MSQNLQNLQNFAKFQKIQLDNLVDFEKCCKTRIFLQKSVPIQPKTSNILPKFCQKLPTTLRVHPRAHRADEPDPVRLAGGPDGPDPPGGARLSIPDTRRLARPTRSTRSFTYEEEYPFCPVEKTKLGKNNRKYRKEKTPIFSCCFFTYA